MTGADATTRGRVDERIVLAVSAIAGVAAASAGARPTGSAAVDIGLVAIFAGAVTWAAASAPWWASAGAAGIGMTIALHPGVAVLGMVGFVGGLVVGLRRDVPELRAVVGGIAVNTLIRSDLDGLFGLSSVIGIVTCTALFLIGSWRRPHPTRRMVLTAVVAVVVIAGIALGAAVATVATARSDITSAADQSRRAIDALQEGNYDEAADLFDGAADGFDGATDAIGGPIASPAYLIPGVAQNLDAGGELAESASAASRAAAEALREADLSNVRFVNGAVDIEALRSLESPLLELRAVLDDLSNVATEVGSPWLVAPLQRELTELGTELSENEVRLDDAIEAVRVAPALLGGDGVE